MNKLLTLIPKLPKIKTGQEIILGREVSSGRMGRVGAVETYRPHKDGRLPLDSNHLPVARDKNLRSGPVTTWIVLSSTARESRGQTRTVSGSRHTVHAFTAAPDGPRPPSIPSVQLPLPARLTLGPTAPATDGVTMAEDDVGPRPSRVLRPTVNHECFSTVQSKQQSFEGTVTGCLTDSLCLSRRADYPNHDLRGERAFPRD